MFHVGNDGSDLLVNASNYTDNAVNAFKLNNDNGGDNYTLADAGWYTFEQNFRNDSGALAVDFNLRDDGGSLVYSVTRSDPTDLISTVVGGNRYGWLIFNDIDGLAFDNTSLAAIPEPGTLIVWSSVTLGFVCHRRRQRDED